MFEVICPDYRSRIFAKRDEAERWLAGVEKLGACQHVHEIVEKAS